MRRAAITFLSTLLLAPAVALAAVTASCPFNDGGGDQVGRGFYVDKYDAYTLDTATLHYGARTAGAYEIELTVTRDQFKGPVVGKASVVVTLDASNTAVTPAVYHFAGATTKPGAALFFSHRLVSGPGDTVFMNTGTGPCANVVETDGTDPPRDVTRRDSLGVTLTGVQANYQGLWWNSPAGSESGWGVNVAHQGDTIFASWFTFSLYGEPMWLVVAADRTGPGTYAGSLYRATSGPPFNAVPFDGSKVTGGAVGTATFSFADLDHGTFGYTVDGITGSKSIVREVFGASVPVCTWGQEPNLALATKYQDLWWAAPAASESGWGINVNHQGDTIFATWFTYNLEGKPQWAVAALDKTGPRTYSGTLYTGLGPAFNAVPFDPAKVKPEVLGTTSLVFADGNNATFAYDIGPISQHKALTRQVFRAPGTVCR